MGDVVGLLHEARTQIAIFTIVALCIVGPYNGLNALGGGGLKDHTLATKINFVYALSLAFFGWIGGALFNHQGARVVSTIAGFAYASYVLVLIAVTFLHANPLLSFPCGVILGFGGSLIWASFGAISIRYPRLQHQGKTFAAMWAVMNLGGLFAGSLSLIANFSSQHAQASPRSYFILGATIAFGTLFAATALRHQETVYRTDGEVAGNSAHTSFAQVLWDGVCVFGEKELRYLWPTFMVPFVHMPFLFNGLNAQYFNIRSRSLNSSLYWAARIPGGFLFHLVVRERKNDLSSTSPLYEVQRCVARRLLPGLYLVFFWAAWCLTISHMAIFNSFGNLPPPIPGMEGREVLDFLENRPAAYLPMVVFASFGMLDALVQSLLYNTLASMAGGDSKKAALYSGSYKSVQSLSMGLFWASDWAMTSWHMSYVARYQTHWLLMLCLWLVSFPGVLSTLLRIRKMPPPPIITERICLASMKGNHPLTEDVPAIKRLA